MHAYQPIPPSTHPHSYANAPHIQYPFLHPPICYWFRVVFWYCCGRYAFICRPTRVDTPLSYIATRTSHAPHMPMTGREIARFNRNSRAEIRERVLHLFLFPLALPFRRRERRRATRVRHSSHGRAVGCRRRPGSKLKFSSIHTHVNNL